MEEVPYESPDFSKVGDIRRAVFVDEQGVDPAHEFDGLEATSTHLLARWEGIPAGAARCYPEGNIARIGRVAVLKEYRKRGLGRALMRHALEILRTRGFAAVLIHSQTQAAPFYVSLGFQEEGEEFMEEGIPHVSMRLTLDRTHR